MKLNNESFEKSEQGPNPIVMIVRGVSGLMKWCRKKAIEDVTVRLAPMDSRLAQLITIQQQNLYAIDGLRKQLDIVASQNQLLEAASRENSRLSQEYYQEHIIDPMIRGLFPVVDLIEDARNAWLDNGCIIYPDVYQLVEGIHTLLCQFLRTYQIEHVRHKPGDKFDPQVMKPAQVICIGVAELNNQIAKSLQAGFYCSGTKRLLRSESVIVYKLEECKPL